MNYRIELVMVSRRSLPYKEKLC